MVDMSLYQKDIPSRTYRRRDDEEDALEIMVPPHRPRSYARTVRLGFVIHVMDEKHARRAPGNREDDRANSAQPSKVAVIEGALGIILIIIGFLAITLIAVGMRAVPLVISAYGIPLGLGMLYLCLRSPKSIGARA
jgi:hypothetical protein